MFTFQKLFLEEKKKKQSSEVKLEAIDHQVNEVEGMEEQVDVWA